MKIKKSKIRAVQAALNRAEAALQDLGPGLQFLLTPEGGVEIARRGEAGEAGEAGEPKNVVARLGGCDPLLWQAERPEGPVSLGLAYRQPRPRCALSGETLQAGAPLELYHRGRPVSPGQAARIAPLLALVRGTVAAAASVIEELHAAAAQVSETDNGELRGIVADRLAHELAGRLTHRFAGAPPGTGQSSIPAGAVPP